jgi:hypothetical protein
VRVVNIEHPIDLYEVAVAPPADWETRCTAYRHALEALERDDVGAAARLVANLQEAYADDRAVRALAQRVAEAQQPLSRGDTSIWQLPGK